MTRHRFSFGPGADLLKHAKVVRVELSVYRGELSLDYSIEGSIAPAFDDSDDGDGGDTLDGPAPEELAGELLAAFIAKAKGGA